MTINQNYIHEMCQGFTSFVEELPYGLFIKYIFHRRGQRSDAIEMDNRFFQSHPAGNTALNILRKSTNSQSSKFHGLAIETTQSMMGLKEQKNVIGLITINLDNHETTESVLQESYHLGWLAIDSARLLKHPKYKSLTSGPLIPKRSPLNLTRASLQADIFSTLILADQGYEGMIKDLAKKRCFDALSAQINGTPWLYAFPLAFETTLHARKNLITTNKQNYHFISTPLEYAASIAKAFNEEDFQQWWSFCKPAQKMAWHNETPQDIVNLAMATSEDPIIKVTTTLITTCTGIEQQDTSNKNSRYNAFVSQKSNKIYHEDAAQETFELVLSESLKIKSATPLFNLANQQNQALTQGNVFGWCASALQSAARAFDKKQQETNNMADIGSVVELGFKASKQEIKYDSLLTLGEDILIRRKQGEVITIEDVEKMAMQQIETGFVGQSIKETIKDPDYQKGLNATQDLNRIYVPNLGPKEPTITRTLNNEPAPIAAPNIASGMGAGGGMMGGGTSVPPVTQTQQQQKEDTEKAE